MDGLIQTQTEQLESLRRAVEALEGRLALRSELDVIVAHEVRTPLTVITGALETLRDLPLGDERVTRLVTMAHEQASHLSGVAEELLLPQLNGGPAVTRARLVVVDAASVINRALAVASVRLGDRRVETEVPDGLQLATSPARLIAVITNLLENAIRYGADPIGCRVSRQEGPVVRIEVTDRGAGLAGADPEELFEAFTQGPDGVDEGRGVGLYLVRMLARSMGGDATLADRRDGGCVARVDLPQRRSEDPVAPMPTGEPQTATS
jgi:two-component system phosphate regulon sensor histidine kinase PhoR